MPEGLTVDTELRWSLLQALAALGAATDEEIEARAGRATARPAASGRRRTPGRCCPTAENKARVWAELTGDERPAELAATGRCCRASSTPAQVELTAPYAAKFFEVVDDVWARSDSEPAQEFVMLAYPAYQVSRGDGGADRRLAGRATGTPRSLRRLVAEGRDGVVRALQGPREGRATLATRRQPCS